MDPGMYQKTESAVLSPGLGTEKIMRHRIYLSRKVGYDRLN